MNMRRPYVLLPFIVVLAALDLSLLYLALYPKPRELEVHFLDVGQGDAILIETPDGIDILIDGGPDRAVLRRLPGKLGLFDRHIDMVVATHPDKDHAAGLVDVLDRYRVSYFLEPGVESDAPHVSALEDAVLREEGIVRLAARRGMRIRLGKDAYADVLYPDRDVASLETNEASVALRLVFGNTAFLMAGDMSSAIEDYIVSLDGERLKSDVLKASHHGSKHSTSEAWLSAIDPSLFVVSAGEGNRYGHPAPEVIERAKGIGAAVITTIEKGTITLVSDGAVVRIR